jgi:hypothetical protein
MISHTLLLLLLLLILTTPDTYYARSLCDSSRQSRGQQRQDQGKKKDFFFKVSLIPIYILPCSLGVVGILTPESVVGGGGVVEPYLPNLGFWADVGGLVLGQNPAVSPFVRLSRDIFESQECAEFVSCEMSRISKRHSPIQFIHT